MNELQMVLEKNERKPIPNTTYGKPQYNVVKGDKQRIELSRGCPNNCPYCFEDYAKKRSDSIVFKIPKIEKNYVEILDMNFLWQPDIVDRIKELGSKKVEKQVDCFDTYDNFGGCVGMGLIFNIST